MQSRITVFASYTDRPLLLVDGMGQETHVKKGEMKNFKYPTTHLDMLRVTVKGSYYESFTVYARVETFNEKFIYPDSKMYNDWISKRSSDTPEVYIGNETNYLGMAYL